MNKKSILISVFFTVIALGILGGLLWRWQTEKWQTELARTNTGIFGLGFTYISVTPQVSDYYDLEVDSGALVTSVTAGGPADRAGIKTGDVILSFNGAALEGSAPLLRAVISCPEGHEILMDVWKGAEVTRISFRH